MGWKTKEQKREYQKKYYKKNRERILKQTREWAKNNPEKRREISRRHARKKSGTTKNSYLQSETHKGWLAEKEVLCFLDGALHVNDGNMNRPYDILWNGIKIDVKSKNIYKRKNKRGKPVKKTQSGWWTFGKGNSEEADYYLCLCKEKGKTIKMYYIPKHAFGKGVCIGHNSKKYDRYLFRA